VGARATDAPADIGAYVLVYEIAYDGRLEFHDYIAVRTMSQLGLASDTGYASMSPINILFHPDGSTGYIPVNAVIMEREVFPHGFAIYAVEDGGARLIEQAWVPALRETRFSDHHGAILASFGSELFLYSYLTDYDTISGGVLQRLRVADDHSLEPLDPPWISTGLFDGRQPISLLSRSP
jgi:hypothetical protein